MILRPRTHPLFYLISDAHLQIAQDLSGSRTLPDTSSPFKTTISESFETFPERMAPTHRRTSDYTPSSPSWRSVSYFGFPERRKWRSFPRGIPFTPRHLFGHRRIDRRTPGVGIPLGIFPAAFAMIMLLLWVRLNAANSRFDLRSNWVEVATKNRLLPIDVAHKDLFTFAI